MKFISPLLALLLLFICAGGLLADQKNIQVQITTSKDRLFNIVTNDDNFKILSDKIVAEIQKRLLNKNIISSTEDIKTRDKIILLIEYGFLETDAYKDKKIYAMSGQFKLIDPENQKVLFDDTFSETKDKISEFVNQVAGKISSGVYRYFK